jgi:hypothetical protein
MARRAKLAHEAKGRQQGAGADLSSRFSVSKVLELVDYNGAQNAVVDFDGKGTLMMIDSFFVRKNAEGELITNSTAIPVTYDRVAREDAVNLYNEYKATLEA